jgi:iron-sulfur cluster assembly protein
MFDNITPVTISAKAADEIRRIMATKNIPDGYRLRIGVRGGSGCGGANFILGFDTPKEFDIEYNFNDIPVLVDKRHTLYLMGKQVDYVANGDTQGFTFVDEPAAKDRSADTSLADRQ